MHCTARPRARAALIAIWLLALPAVHAVDEGAENCEALVEGALDFYRSLPTAFHRSGADRLAAQSEETLGKCQRALRSCRDSLDPERYAAAQFVAAKMLFILSKRYRLQLLGDLTKDPALTREEVSSELDRHFKSYLSEVHSLAREAYDALPPEHSLRPRALETLAFSLHQAGEYAESAKVCRDFISKYPEDERADTVINALGRACLDGGSYDAGIELLETALREHYASESYPYFVETLRKLHVRKGDIAGFEKTVKQGLLTLGLKSKSTRAPRHLRDACDRLFLYYGFWKGYGRMSAGDLDGARAAFREHIDLINAREASEQEKGGQLRPEYVVFRGRSSLTLSFLSELAERPPPRELDLSWVTERKTLLSESLGKVVGILFRNVDDQRSKEFMGELSRMCSVKPELELTAVHYLRPGQNAEIRGEELRSEIAALGYTGTAGFDPDQENQSLLRSYGVRVGSASFVIVDRGGNLVWLTEDPRMRDVAFAASVMLRVAKES